MDGAQTDTWTLPLNQSGTAIEHMSTTVLEQSIAAPHAECALLRGGFSVSPPDQATKFIRLDDRDRDELHVTFGQYQQSSSLSRIGVRLEMKKVSGLNEFYSKFENDKIDMFIEVDARGYPTTSKPHVHVVFRERSNQVDVIATNVDGRHLSKETLRNPSGNDVRRAVEKAQQKLR